MFLLPLLSLFPLLLATSSVQAKTQHHIDDTNSTNMAILRAQQAHNCAGNLTFQGKFKFPADPQRSSVDFYGIAFGDSESQCNVDFSWPAGNSTYVMQPNFTNSYSVFTAHAEGFNPTEVSVVSFVVRSGTAYFDYATVTIEDDATSSTSSGLNSSSSGTTTVSKSKHPIAPIVGGVVGGAVALTLLFAGIWIKRRRRRISPPDELVTQQPKAVQPETVFNLATNPPSTSTTTVSSEDEAKPLPFYPSSNSLMTTARSKQALAGTYDIVALPLASSVSDSDGLSSSDQGFYSPLSSIELSIHPVSLALKSPEVDQPTSIAGSDPALQLFLTPTNIHGFRFQGLTPLNNKRPWIPSRNEPTSHSMELENIPDLTGKIFIVAGANTGTGYETFKSLLKKHAKLYTAARSFTKGRDAIQRLKEETGNEAIFLHLDLGDLNSVKGTAEELKQKESQLHVLINIACVMTPPKNQFTTQGWDLQFGTNVVDHFLLIKLLLPTLLDAARSSPAGTVRNVNAGSSAQYWYHDIPFKDSKVRNKLCPEQLYGISKGVYLQLTWVKRGEDHLLFSRETLSVPTNIAKRYDSDGIVSTSLNPGAIATDSARHSSNVVQRMFFAHPPILGAIIQLWAASSDEGKNLNGRFAHFLPVCVTLALEPGQFFGSSNIGLGLAKLHLAVKTLRWVHDFETLWKKL
ncbi:hypothetical protein DL96DRAFT_1724077 [Flagelloscypha sp. PMI_526]|nr:hypothetical protein DL96DRAFT_1724077 [Flagelloscypha sp. PMI_526]